MPPPGYEPFLAAICANPDDDTPRLVYADWLDENGDPERAEFIRCQIACPDWPGWPDLHFLRAKELQKTHQEAWRAELPNLKGVNWGGFYRGFIAKVSFSESRYFGKWWDAVFPAAPIQVVFVRNMVSWLFDRFLLLPYMTHIREFAAGEALDDASVERLAATPGASRLESLSLTGMSIVSGQSTALVGVLSDVAAFALARSPHLGRLKELTLIHTSITHAGLSELRDRFGAGVSVYPQPPTPPPCIPRR